MRGMPGCVSMSCYAYDGGEAINAGRNLMENDQTGAGKQIQFSIYYFTSPGEEVCGRLLGHGKTNCFPDTPYTELQKLFGAKTALLPPYTTLFPYHPCIGQMLLPLVEAGFVKPPPFENILPDCYGLPTERFPHGGGRQLEALLQEGARRCVATLFRSVSGMECGAGDFNATIERLRPARPESPDYRVDVVEENQNITELVLSKKLLFLFTGAATKRQSL